MLVTLTQGGCRNRQQRFAGWLGQQGFDLAILTDWRDVYYFTGAIKEVPYPRAVIIQDDGRTTLLAEAEYPQAAADRQEIYALLTMATLNFDPNDRLTTVLKDCLPKARRTAVQRESLLHQAAQAILDVTEGDLVAIDDDLLRMQAVKDEDELSVIRRANELNDVGYAAAHEVILEGSTEAEVLGAAQAAVTAAAGCYTPYNGDFQCGVPGGFATGRACRAGELYVIDAWVHYQGYWSDNCRTFAVTSLDDNQRRAWEKTENTVLEAEKAVQPGVSCRSVFELMKEMQEEIQPNALMHHGGHGVGLRNHGYPRINPHFDDVFEAGNIITMEPGVYGEDLQGGIRLEYNYLVTEKGPQRLNQFPISIPE